MVFLTELRRHPRWLSLLTLSTGIIASAALLFVPLSGQSLALEYLFNADFAALFSLAAGILTLGIFLVMTLIYFIKAVGIKRITVIAASLSGALLITIGILTFGGIVQNQAELESGSDENREPSWQTAAFSDLAEDVNAIWPGYSLLVARKAQALNIAFQNTPPIDVHYIELSRPDYVFHISKLMKQRKFPFFIGRIFREKDAGDDVHARGMIKTFEDNYRDVTDWFKKRYGVKSCTPVYCLKDLDPEAIFRKYLK
jgi:hypothetical protein